MGKRPVLTFSHVGIWVTDLEAMREFYADVLGFVMTDRGPIGDTELVFLSQSPGDHHQLVLAKGRPHDVAFTTVNQISYKLDSLETLKAMHAEIVKKPVKDLVQISHGNAWSIYFKDPEGNRIELFVDTPWYTPQPCREPLDLTQPVEQIKKQTEDYCRSRARFQSHGEWQRELKDKIAASR
ncbi:MAG TPA: VOC family protein [Methylomirabilota bacterium]|jgi:catechol-2,3-dioxygenase|nr:VOC family protein [Methylomirabilota bacterium]